MSEVVNVVEQEQQQQQQQQQQQLQQPQQQQLQQPPPQQQQQQRVGGSSNKEPYCEECNIPFNSDKSLQVHLQYQHNSNLIKGWANLTQQESNNNNSKAGNHNKHASIKPECVTVSADSREPSSSQDPSQQQQPQQQQQPSIQAYNNYLSPIPYPSVNLLQNMSHVQNIPMSTCQPFSPPHEDVQGNGGNGGGGGSVGGGYARYHPYPQHFGAEHASTNSTSPRSPSFHCENCGAVYEDANQLGEHMKTHHSGSPTGYGPAPQYQQLGGSPPQSDQQQAQQQLHASPTHSSQQPQQQQQQQPGYDYNGGQPVKLEMKQEPEEQTEILDLDSHKVQQTHRYQEGMMSIHHHQHHHPQEIHMHMHHPQQVMQQHPQQRLGHFYVGSVPQPHDYHTGLPPMSHMDGMPPIADQSQFMRGQHMPPVEGSVHQAASLITNAQPMPGHQLSTGLPQLQQQLKPPSNQTWKSNEPRRPKTYNCTACNKWFTSSGHLKRHYNTTLHKNAVKQSNQPDPANLPISTHHHPSRDNNVAHPTSSRGGGGSGAGVGGGAPERSPDFASSGSPPNVMAGPSGEATGGLHHTPIPHYNSNNSNSSSSNDSLAAAAALAQQQQQRPPSAVLLASGMVPHSSPQPSSMAGHHQQPMGSPSHQMGLPQQQQQLHHLPMTSPGQHQVQHHSMTSPISPMHPPPASHLSSPSQMDSSTHPHHMNSGTVHPAMVSPTAMGGTSMPRQPYPNAMPPHVSNTSSIPGLLEPITITGNDQNPNDQHQQQQQQQHQQAQENLLPSFGTLSPHQTLPSFTELVPGFAGDQNQAQSVNVGGLSSEAATPENSSVPDYDLYTNSPSRYELVEIQSGLGDIHINRDNNMVMRQYDMTNQQQSYPPQHFVQIRSYPEKNNNELPQGMRMVRRVSRGRRPRSNSKVLKEQQQRVTGIAATEIDEIDTRTVQCDECAKRFNKTCYLTQHKKSFHMGEKPFKCSQCGKRFHDNDIYKRHQAKHLGDKPHKCESCPKQFNHKTDLRRHLCVHTGDKPYSCSNCGKKFIRKDHMVKHVATHVKKSQNRKSNTEHKKENVRKRVNQCPT